ncbi:MAG: hypothetical protein L3K23_00500 [Thermoplasmata archaeon]|nr:hypothetical protein [Thermoplasmata archaeon]
MGLPLRTDGAPDLLWLTVRRSIALGRLYLVVGTAYLVLLAVATSFTGGTTFAVVSTLFLPTFVVVGSLGGVIVFTSDRQKGVFEYLLAYGLSPRRLFENILAATLILATIVVATSVAVDVVVLAAAGHPVPLALIVGLGVYGLPMGYGSAAFTAMVGMYWTALSTPRQGMSSPIGVLPLVGIVPSLATLAAAFAFGITDGASFYLVVGLAVAIVGGVVVVLLTLIDRLLPYDRFLSPM